VKNLTIARRYAKALLIIGKEDGQAETYGKELDGFAKMMAKEKELEQAICNPLYGASGRKKVLETVIGKVGISKIVSSFLLLLFDKGRFDFLSDINNFYQKLADELKGVLQASLVSASELSSETVEKIRTTLSKRTGKDIILQVEQDSSLIGGIVSRIGDLVLDGSIKSQLLNMRESLKRGESI
jgi:F-type H+-transporting ATPase subunit delta